MAFPTQIMEPGDLYTLPAGSVIRHKSPLNGIEAAVKTEDGDWLVTGDPVEYDPDSLCSDQAWIGAEVLTPVRIAAQAAAMADAMAAGVRAITGGGDHR